ncbi:hypothetical protein N7444_002048 [Penicillium canescens]|nr:hypothetical protein N7444_002048 [Penicillium canescens]
MSNSRAEEWMSGPIIGGPSQPGVGSRSTALSKENVYAPAYSQSISGYYRPAPPTVLVVTEYGLYFASSAI